MPKTTAILKRDIRLRYQVFLHNSVHGTSIRLYTNEGVVSMDKFIRHLRELCSDDSCTCSGITGCVDKNNNLLTYQSDKTCENMVFRRVI